MDLARYRKSWNSQGKARASWQSEVTSDIIADLILGDWIGQTISYIGTVNIGAPHRSLLEPIFLLLNVNDVPNVYKIPQGTEDWLFFKEKVGSEIQRVEKYRNLFFFALFESSSFWLKNAIKLNNNNNSNNTKNNVNNDNVYTIIFSISLTI